MRLPMVPSPRDVLALVDRGGETLERVLSALPRIVPLLNRADALLGELERLVARIEGTRRSAEQLVTGAQEPLSRLARLVDSVEPPLMLLRPVLAQIAAGADAGDAATVRRLLDRLPNLVDRFEQDVLPIIDASRTLAPDMHDLLDASRQLNELLVNVPGMGRIKKKLEEESSDDQ